MANAPPKLWWFSTDDGLPPFAQAASLALGVLEAAGVPTWAGLSELDGLDVVLADDQLECLAGHFGVVSAVRGLVRGVSKRRSIIYCDVCWSFELVTTGAASSSKKCALTVGCGGELVRVSPAKKAKVSLEDLMAAERPEVGDPVSGDGDGFDAPASAGVPWGFDDFDDPVAPAIPAEPVEFDPPSSSEAWDAAFTFDDDESF